MLIQIFCNCYDFKEKLFIANFIAFTVSKDCAAHFFYSKTFCWQYSFPYNGCMQLIKPFYIVHLPLKILHCDFVFHVVLMRGEKK